MSVLMSPLQIKLRKEVKTQFHCFQSQLKERQSLDVLRFAISRPPFQVAPSNTFASVNCDAVNPSCERMRSAIRSSSITVIAPPFHDRGVRRNCMWEAGFGIHFDTLGVLSCLSKPSRRHLRFFCRTSIRVVGQPHRDFVERE